MKKFAIVAFLVCSLFSCMPPVAEQDGAAIFSPERAVYGPYVVGPFYGGGRSEIETFIHYAYVRGSVNAVSVNVGLGEVLIGGGAKVFYNGANAMLTGSYPSWNDPDAASYFDGWVAESRQHIITGTHWTMVYAIGMKLKRRDGVYGYVPQETVQSCIKSANSPISEYGSQPVASIACPKYWLIIGGGARVFIDSVNSYGNFLTESMAEGVAWGGTEDGCVGGGAWVARSTDHIVVSPARIQAFSITIRYGDMAQNTHIPLFGDMNVKCVTGGVLNTQVGVSGQITCFTGTDPNGMDVNTYFGGTWSLAGVGGQAVWNNTYWGRMLYGVGYSWSGATPFWGGYWADVCDKDQINGDSGTLTAQLFLIRPDTEGYGGEEE